MSIAMSRPTLPSISQSAPQLPRVSTSSEIRSLPPLSALLNTTTTSSTPDHNKTRANSDSVITSPIPYSAPVSPTVESNVTSATSTTSSLNNQFPNVMKTPVRLPSFDSIKFDQGKSALPHQQLQHSSSFTLPTPTSQPHHHHQHHPLPMTAIPQQQPQPQQLQPQPQQQQQNLVSPLVEKRSYAFISHSPSTFPLQEPSIDNAQLARRKRRRTSPLELSILQSEFEKGQTPNRTRRLDIANKVNMTEKAIQIWFQNRRQTLRRQSNAEREIHHIEPIYQAQTPIRQSNMIYQTPNVPHPFNTHPLPLPQQVFNNNTNSSSSPLEQHHSADSSRSSSPHSAHNSSPINQSTKIQFSVPQNPQLPQSQPQVLVTPARTPKQFSNSSTSPVHGGSTLTFRLSSKPTPVSSTDQSLTQLPQVLKTRQKPVMKVNPSPHKNVSSSPASQKENVSPMNSSPVKRSSTTSPVKKENRAVLKELSFNAKNQPKRNDEDCVNNLLNLRNWRH